LYDTYLEFIDHFKENREYFTGAYTDEDDLICGEYSIEILGNKLPSESYTVDCLFYKIDFNKINQPIKENLNIDRADKEKDILNLLIDVAIENDNKNLFLYATGQLSKLTKF